MEFLSLLMMNITFSILPLLQARFDILHDFDPLGRDYDRMI